MPAVIYYREVGLFMKLFIDQNLTGKESAPSPISDAEYREYEEYFHKKIADYKNRLINAGCPKSAGKLEKEFQCYADHHAMASLGVDWLAVLDSLLMVYCQASIQAQIKFTPKKYRRCPWTPELLEPKITACGLDNQARYYIYREAGLDYPEPEWMQKHHSE